MSISSFSVGRIDGKLSVGTCNGHFSSQTGALGESIQSSERNLNTGSIPNDRTYDSWTGNPGGSGSGTFPNVCVSSVERPGNTQLSPIDP